ncbi:otopetrin-3-like protein [Dinothrombium tinctorium]|uniref:Otopetrin-3-like protein n=1 Tax=Dinothrombium tinctorium TaxID=1965070 RepID=A0A3S3PCX6_9ACAR|nr:otopetrin-3-like protein [Dinothrombium tinctorium]
MLPLRLLPNTSTFDSQHAFQVKENQTLIANGNNPCQKEDIIGPVLEGSSPYLYPFIVEYSLSCAAFLYVMWCNIGRNTRSVSEYSSKATNFENGEAGESHNSPPLYNCLASKKAILISDVSHSLLLVLCSIATVIGYIKITKLKFKRSVQDTVDNGLRDLLLKIAAFGLYSYSLFGVIAGALEIYSIDHCVVFLTSILTIIQVTLQTMFISDIVCRRKVTEQYPGRQLVTFLLIANFTFWIIYTFEMQKVEASPVQLSIYGFTPWALIVRITLPLSIFYRFHSAITFAEIWKNTYR